MSLTDRAVLGEGASLVATTLSAGTSDTRLDGQVVLAGEAAFAEVGERSSPGAGSGMTPIWSSATSSRTA